MDKAVVQEIVDDLMDLPSEKLEQVKHFVRSVKEMVIQPTAKPPAAETSAKPPDLPGTPTPGLDSTGMFIVWRCTRCGHLFVPGEELTERCPDCEAPKEEFVLVEED